MKIFKPTYFVDNVTDISLQFLNDQNIKALILDIDDTLTAHKCPLIDEDIKDWIENLKSYGIKLILVSNNFKKRVSDFARMNNMQYVYFGLKPLPSGFFKALKILNIKKNEAVIVGDQIFTDIIGANIAGFRSILVEPRSESKTLFLKIKRYIKKNKTK